VRQPSDHECELAREHPSQGPRESTDTFSEQQLYQRTNTGKYQASCVSAGVCV